MRSPRSSNRASIHVEPHTVLGVAQHYIRDLVYGANDGVITTFAVVAGITYNFFPFMALPLYVSLEQIDARLLEAAKDLYASSTKAFLKVTLPLSAPGIVAGTLLTFIPAAGDFINAALLGTPNQAMIGNVIQAKFLESLDYPTAASLSFILMGTILRLIGADITIYVNHGGRFNYRREECLSMAEKLRAPLGAIRTAFPAPAGGMSLDRVDEMAKEYGRDTVLVFGGAMLGGPGGVGKAVETCLARLGA